MSIYARATLNPRLLNEYIDSSVTLQLSQQQWRLHLIGAYLHQADSASHRSVTEEIEKLQNVYLNPSILLCGDFNDFHPKLSKRFLKMGWSTTTFEVTREAMAAGVLQQSVLDGLFSTESITDQHSEKLAISDHFFLKAAVKLGTKVQKYFASERVPNRGALKEHLARHPLTSLCEDASARLRHAVPDKLISEPIARPSELWHIPYDSNWHERSKAYFQQAAKKKIESLNAALASKDLKLIFKLLRDHTGNSKYSHKARQNPDGTARHDYQAYYRELFHSDQAVPQPPQYTDIDDDRLQAAIKESIKQLRQGKAISTDRIPDDLYSKDRLE